VISERPFADGRRTAVFVFNELKPDGGRLTQMWLARLQAFDAAGWATHAAFINKDAALSAKVDRMVAEGRFPAGTGVHHYALRDRTVRASWWGPLPDGQTMDDRVGDWLDWLTGQVPGAVVVADSPAAYPYVARMTNPLVARVAGIHLNHLADASADADPSSAMVPRFAARFADVQQHFDALVTPTAWQAADLRSRLGSDTPVTVIPPAVGHEVQSGAVVPAPLPRRMVSVGALESGYHHDGSIRALHSLSGRYPDLRLEIVGEGDRAEGLLELAAQLGVANRVSLLPASSQGIWAGTRLALWTGNRESCPLAIIQALGAGVPVVAHDVRYGPRELITDARLGALVDPGADLASTIDAQLRTPHEPQEVLDAAGSLVRRTEPRAVGQRWVALAAELADQVCDHRAPSLLVETISTHARVIRVMGVLADSASPLTAWACQLPNQPEPAGWLAEPIVPPADEAEADDEPPVHPHAAGPTREVVLRMRSDALAFAATESGEPFPIEFGDGTTTVRVLTTQVSDRIIAARIGNATLSRRSDGSLWVSPRRELLFASNVDGRLLVRTGPDEPPSDVTHAIDWVVDIDWKDLSPGAEGVSFVGMLRAVGIAPADDSPPAVCVADVGGFARSIGVLHYTGEPRIEGLEWSAPVSGMIETDPLVATTQLARRALPLFVGYRGLLAPIGGLWTHGARTRMLLSSERGEVTLLPSPGGRVLAAPGRGYRARMSGALRTAVRGG
jgi:glycosyltransferase involved in cell wall biosynthesis